MIGKLRIASIALVLFPITLLLMPIQYLFVLGNLALARKLPVIWHRLALWCFGIRVQVKGSLEVKRPLMLVANHVSWTDILVLGSLGPVSFVAKEEVSSIPFAGLLAYLQRSIFVNRQARSRAAEQASEITSRILDGDIIVLFAEGTTGDGNYVLPFKSSLFGAAKMAIEKGDTGCVYFQPVSIAYTHCHGMRMNRHHRSRAAWPGTIGLREHAAMLLREGVWDVHLSFCAPVIFDSATKRKQIAQETHSRINEQFQIALYGRNG